MPGFTGVVVADEGVGRMEWNAPSSLESSIVTVYGKASKENGPTAGGKFSAAVIALIPFSPLVDGLMFRNC